jgi:PTH1 family peptidyl-tRNA hydrolase
VRVVFGIGNPGPRYALTRHNVGFMVLDHLADVEGATWRPIPGLNAEGAPVRIADDAIWLIKPLTYVNACGPVLAAIHTRDAVPLSDLLVVVDDLALPVARLRLRAGGGDGGHNGLRSLITHLASEDFPRLRIGIGAPGPVPSEQYVLEPFPEPEREALAESVERAGNAVRRWVEAGIERAMGEVNRPDLDQPEGRA